MKKQKVISKYAPVLSWSEEDKAFIAEVPELPGCAADARTRREALKNVEVIIPEWIETARELGRPIPHPKGRLVLPDAIAAPRRRCNCAGDGVGE